MGETIKAKGMAREKRSLFRQGPDAGFDPRHSSTFLLGGRDLFRPPLPGQATHGRSTPRSRKQLRTPSAPSGMDLDERKSIDRRLGMSGSGAPSSGRRPPRLWVDGGRSKLGASRWRAAP